MRIESDVKLDFKDVLIRPKRSTLRSRSEVDLVREYKFLHSDFKWKGIPIIASNMDHTGTFDVAKVLAGHEMCTAIYKFAPTDVWADALKQNPELKKFVFVTAGSSEEDFHHLE